MDGTILGKKYDLMNGHGGGGGSESASDVSFNGTESGLVATNVQDAIDEIVVNFQDGVDDVYDACVAKGSTPASHGLSDVITAIGNIETGGSSSLTVLRTGTGSGSDMTINESFNIIKSGYLIATSFVYIDSMSMSINGGNNLLTKDGYYFSDNIGYHAVSEGDVITFSGTGSGRCYDYMTLLFTDAEMPS